MAFAWPTFPLGASPALRKSLEHPSTVKARDGAIRDFYGLVITEAPSRGFLDEPEQQRLWNDDPTRAWVQRGYCWLCTRHYGAPSRRFLCSMCFGARRWSGRQDSAHRGGSLSGGEVFLRAVLDEAVAQFGCSSAAFAMFLRWLRSPAAAAHRCSATHAKILQLLTSEFPPLFARQITELGESGLLPRDSWRVTWVGRPRPDDPAAAGGAVSGGPEVSASLGLAATLASKDCIDPWNLDPEVTECAVDVPRVIDFFNLACFSEEASGKEDDGDDDDVCGAAGCAIDGGGEEEEEEEERAAYEPQIPRKGLWRLVNRVALAEILPPRPGLRTRFMLWSPE